MNPVAKITDIVEHFKKNWSESLGRESIEEVCRDFGYSWRERSLGPATTVQLLMLQVLLGNTSCNHLRYYSEFEFSASSYCEARQRLPLEVLEESVQRDTAFQLHTY